MKNDGSMTSQLLKMDDSKSGETRIDELTSGKEIKRQLIRAMKEVSTPACIDHTVYSPHLANHIIDIIYHTIIL